MDFLDEKLFLGIVASGMVLLGLPMARLRVRSTSYRLFLYALSSGILLMLLVDLIGHARELPQDVLAGVNEASSGLAVMVALLFLGGAVAGFLVLWYLGRVVVIRPKSDLGTDGAIGARTLRLSALVAVGIGLYNFAQGIGIGEAGLFTVPTAVASGEGNFLLLLGFALHNTAKGAAIAIPLIGQRPSWKYLLVLGIVAGLPTAAGVLVGMSFWLPYLFVGVLTFAAGATLLVLVRSFSLQRPLGSKKRIASGVVAGMLVATITTFALEMSHYSLPELRPSFWL